MAARFGRDPGRSAPGSRLEERRMPRSPRSRRRWRPPQRDRGPLLSPCQPKISGTRFPGPGRGEFEALGPCQALSLTAILNFAQVGLDLAGLSGKIARRHQSAFGIHGHLARYEYDSPTGCDHDLGVGGRVPPSILDFAYQALRFGSSRQPSIERLSLSTPREDAMINRPQLAQPESASPTETARELAARVPAPIEQILFEVKRLIVGQDRLLERLLIALLAEGHVLLQGVPGPAKTVTVKAFAQVIGGAAGRIQFTPDLVPADLIGTRIYNPSRGEFTTELGPVFCNLLLADEINRAPAKVQSALLEAMQERQVTIGKETHRVPDPFVVLATENPIETDGTYPLPEAQLDRFMLKVLVDYPSFQEEVVVVERITGPEIELRQVVTLDQLKEMQKAVTEVYVDPAVRTYAATLAYASRPGKVKGLEDLAPSIAYGASPRASINLVAAGRALAFMRGRSYVLPHDLSEVAPEVIRHRLVLTYEGIASGVNAETIVKRVLERFPPPRIDLGDRVAS